jgi:hypothetical protein
MTRRVILSVAGCGLAVGLAGLGSQRSLHAASTVTFSENVAPIVFNHCTTCHRPGEAAPFTLMNYDEVMQHGKLIATVTEARRMPPWKAGPSDYAFKNERRLSDAEIATIQQWIDAGMPEGDARKMPPVPAFTEGWTLGKPDLVVSMKEPFPVPAYGRDIYRNFVLPLNLTEDKWVRAIDFRPTARTVVHHSLFYLDDTGAARAQDAKDSLPGYSGGMGGGIGVGGRGAANLQQVLGLLLNRGGLAGDAQDIGSAPDMGGVVSRVSGGLGGWALGAQAVWASLLCLTGTYSNLLDYVVFAVLIFYVLTILGLFILRRKRPDAERPYRAFGYPVVPALYVGVASAILLVLLLYKTETSWPGLLIVLAGVPFYFLWSRRAAAPAPDP